MVKNMYKEKITECVFDNEPLVKVYERICNLETPYIWYTDNFKGEQLYLINDIRYLPNDMDSAYILYEGEKFPLRKTNRNDNCHTRRNNTPTIDYSKAGGES